MLKNKSAILLLVMIIVCLLSGYVFATETTSEINAGKVFTSADGNAELNADVSHTYSAVRVIDGGNLKITGGNIKGLTDPKDGFAMAVWAKGAGVNVTITGGNFTNELDPADPTQSDMIEATAGAHIVIEGGTFKCATPNWTLNCQDNSGSTITVKGGEFYRFNPALANYDPSYGDPDSTTGVAPKDGKPEIIVPDTHKVVRIDEDWYKVVEKATVEAGKVYTSDAELNGNVKYSYSAVRVDSGKLTISGGDIKGLTSPNGGYAMAVWAKGADSRITITGGNFTNELDPADLTQSDMIEATAGAHIVIEGGTFKCATPNWTLNCQDNSGSTITVKGGKFYRFNPALANYDPSYGDPDSTTGVAPKDSKPEIIVEEGYTVEKIDENWYQVVCAHPENKLTHVDAVKPTYTADGNIEHYKCYCGKLLDANKNVVTNVIDPMLIQIAGNNATVEDVVIDEALKDAGNSPVVELPPVGNATSVTVPSESLKDVVAADKGLVVETSDATVTLDATTVKEILEQTTVPGSMITIEVEQTEEHILSKEQKEAIKDKEVAIILTAKIISNGDEISNFNGGKVKVEIPFTPAEGTKGSDYKVYYIADDGKVEAIPTRYVKGKLVVELEHFSEYVVVKEVATTGAGAPAPSAPAANPNEKDNTPKTGAISVIGLIVAMSVIGLAVLRKRD